MTRVVVAQRMWQRRGTAAEWEAKNPILEAGEIGIELGANAFAVQKVKVGNGVTPWNDLDYSGGGVGPPGPSNSAYFGGSFDGGTGDIQSGAFCDIAVPFGFLLTRVRIVTGSPGSITFDVRNCRFDDFPPTADDSICGSSLPSLAAGQATEIEDPPTWQRAIPSDSVFRFVVVNATGVKRANINIEGIRR